MKLSLQLAFMLLLSLSAFAQVEEIRYYAVPATNLALMPSERRPQVLAQLNGLNLVRMNTRQVRELSATLHNKRSICGGYMDVQVQMEMRGWRADQALAWAASRTPVRSRLDKAEPSFPEQVGKVLTVTRKERFQKTLTDLAAFPDRYSAGPNGVKAAEWLEARALALAKAAGRTDIVSRRIETGGRHVQFSVVVIIPGADPKLPGVLVGGHMDTYQDQKPGADDDGTGSASSMEIYTAILESGLRFKRNLFFAFYAAEEWGLYGSQKVVAEFQKNKIELRGALQFDMTGFRSPKDDKDIYLITDYTDASLTGFLRKLSIGYVKVPAEKIGETRCGYACSDHASWNRAGYPAAFPFESSFQNYNKALHTGKDGMQLVDIDHAMLFVRLGSAFMVELGDPVTR